MATRIFSVCLPLYGAGEAATSARVIFAPDSVVNDQEEGREHRTDGNAEDGRRRGIGRRGLHNHLINLLGVRVGTDRHDLSKNRTGQLKLRLRLENDKVGKPKPKQKLAKRLNHRRDSGGIHVPHALIKSTVRGHDAAKQQSRRNGEHAESRAGVADVQSIRIDRSQHHYRAGKSGHQKGALRNFQRFIDVGKPLLRHALRDQAGDGNRQAGHRQRVKRQIQIICAGKISHAASAEEVAGAFTLTLAVPVLETVTACASES